VESRSFSNYIELCEFVKKFDVVVDHHFEKITKKIFSLIESRVLPIRVVTIEALLEIPPVSLLKIDGVGVTYAHLLEELQSKLSGKKFDPLEVLEDSQKVCFPKSLSQDLQLIQKGFSPQETRYLNNMSKMLGGLDLFDILELDTGMLLQHKGYGKNKLQTILELKHKVFQEFFKIAQLRNDFKYGNSNIITSINSNFYAGMDLEEAIIDEIEDFALELPEKECDIFLSRLGFNQEPYSLEEIGQKYKVTRERIRQIDKKIFNQFLKTLPLEQIKGRVVRDSEDKFLTMPILYSLFEKEKSFYNFFARLLESSESGEFEIDVFKPLTSTKILDEFCAENKSPFEKEYLINGLVSNTGINFIKASITLDFLEDEGVFVKDSAGCYLPAKLGKKEALAHTLLNFPNGLPWQDAATVTNRKGFSQNKISKDRVDGAFSLSEWIYQSGRGIYKHVLFSSLDDIQVDKVLMETKNYLNSLNSKSCHLNEYFQIFNKAATNLGYFELRHIVREYGEIHGIYFNGKSGQDSVSLNGVTNLGGQQELIINLLNGSSGPLSTLEIAQKLRSQSLRHAQFYLHELMNDKKVVRVENMQYSTPEKIFKNIDRNKLLSQIKELVSKAGMPVEADILRKELNLKNRFNYSKYFYLSLVYTDLNEVNLFRLKTFISSNPLEFNGLSGLTKSVCDKKLSFRENVDLVKKEVLITNSVAENAVSQFLYIK
jgi:hypothetical protein